MLIKKHLILLAAILTCSGFTKVCAQNSSDWQPIYLMVTGANVMDGVEASFKLGSCNNQDVVFVKFVNRNEYPVKLEWSDAIFNTELKWVYRTDINARKSFSLKAKEQAEGECINNKQADLIISVKDFVSSKENVKRYSASKLLITPIQ